MSDSNNTCKFYCNSAPNYAQLAYLGVKDYPKLPDYTAALCMNNALFLNQNNGTLTIVVV